MPRSLDPSSRLTLVLACDVDKPEATQPRIYAQTLTLSKQRKMFAAMEAMQTSSPTAQIDAALDAAEICLTGWVNMTDSSGKEIKFNRENIGDVLSIEELTEIFEAVTSASVATASDKKK